MKKILFYSNAILLLTSIHHIYGAILYQTPERLHILYMSIPLIGFNAYMHYSANERRTIKIIHAILTILFPVVLIGVFEGIYNHALKNILFFIGTPKEIMIQMFPPPVYVMPNDFWFEFTGVLQAILVLPALYYCYCHYFGIRQ